MRKASTVSLDEIPFASSKEDWLKARDVISGEETVKTEELVIPFRDACMVVDSSPDV